MSVGSKHTFAAHSHASTVAAWWHLLHRRAPSYVFHLHNVTNKGPRRGTGDLPYGIDGGAKGNSNSWWAWRGRPIPLSSDLGLDTMHRALCVPLEQLDKTSWGLRTPEHTLGSMMNAVLVPVCTGGFKWPFFHISSHIAHSTGCMLLSPSTPPPTAPILPVGLLESKARPNQKDCPEAFWNATILWIKGRCHCMGHVANHCGIGCKRKGNNRKTINLWKSSLSSCDSALDVLHLKAF